MGGKLFIISGPSGVGKDTIIEAIIARIPNLAKAISYTDREKRTDDQQNSYHFISREEFDDLIEDGEIFEWEYARDFRRYGSSKKEVMELLNSGKNIIKVVGPKMFQNIKKIFGKTVIGIFLEYQNIDLLKDRIKKNRADISPDDLEIRYKQAFVDMSYKKYYDYSVINYEGQPELAISEVERIIKENLL